MSRTDSLTLLSCFRLCSLLAPVVSTAFCNFCEYAALLPCPLVEMGTLEKASIASLWCHQNIRLCGDNQPLPHPLSWALSVCLKRFVIPLHIGWYCSVVCWSHLHWCMAHSITRLSTFLAWSLWMSYKVIIYDSGCGLHILIPNKVADTSVDGDQILADFGPLKTD